MNISSLTDFIKTGEFLTGATVVAGCIRRSRFLPTPGFLGFAAIQGFGTAAIIKGAEWIEKKAGVNPRTELDEKSLQLFNYVVAQGLSIALSLLAIHTLAGLGISLLYDMNYGARSLYDFGSIFCIAGQTALVTLTAVVSQVAKDLFQA
jgi:hypothetical protein